MSVSGLRHIGLTLSADPTESARFYTTGLGVGLEQGHASTTHDAQRAAATGATLLSHKESGLVVSLRFVESAAGFDPDLVGADHVSFNSEHTLDGLISRLDEMRLAHGEPSPIPEAGITIVALDDPSGFQVEYTPLGEASPNLVHHIRLTVPDIQEAVAFYQKLGFAVAMPGPEPEYVLRGGVLLAHPGTGFLLGLGPAKDGSTFDADRVGLNYLAFSAEAGELDGLAEAVGASAQNGVISVTDPAGIPVEIVAS